jgi:membrane-bound serine protease (ClpP class)
MFLLLALFLYLVLPSPWNVVGAVASIGFLLVEVVFWQRRFRGVKAQTGAEQLLGATGEATERLAPTGHIRVLGELWEAHSSSEIAPGTTVRVIGVDGLTLEVEAARPAAGDRPV